MGKGHVGRHCPYTYKIWCGSVHALLRYRSKTTKVQKFPIDSYSSENFISPFFRPRGPITPKRGEDTSRTRVRPHANFGVNRPAGCRKIVDKKRTNKKNTVKQTRVIIKIIINNNNNSNNKNCSEHDCSWGRPEMLRCKSIRYRIFNMSSKTCKCGAFMASTTKPPPQL